MRHDLCPLLLVVLLAAGCRDEQAGPQHRQAAQAQEQGREQGIPHGRVLDQVPPLPYRSGATLGGGAIQYLGSRWAPPVAQPGQPFYLAHYFRALKQPPSGWKFFVHVVDAASGQMVLNADHDFQQGDLPLERWPVGKVVEDIHAFRIPEAASGNLRVLLGFWQGDARLPVDQPQAQDGTNRLLGPVIQVPSQALPEYHAKKIAHPPVIDGDLSDPVWRKATPVTLVNSMDGSPTAVKTVARVLYDDQNIYIAFDCDDPDVWGTMTKRDDAIYTQQTVEAFFDANGDGKTYNELEVSPNNTIFDAYFPARRQGMDLSWDSGMKSAVKVQGTLNDASDVDKGWTVEMQIPINRLAEVPHVPPQKGDRWRFNLYRIDNKQGKQVGGQAFSPLYLPDFHNLPRFGWLVFDG